MSMETEAGEFVSLFKRHLNGKMSATIRWATCKLVDWDAKTMDCIGVSDELEYFDVSLGFGSVDTKPAVDSDCLIAILEGNESVAFLIYANEVELLQFNGGENGGLTITPELVTQLNKTNELLQAIMAVISGTQILEPGNGSPSALQIALKAAITGKQLGDYSNIEDSKITH